MANENDARVEIHSGPDGQGRYIYTLYWWVDYCPGHPDGERVPRERGQVYHAKLPRGVCTCWPERGPLGVKHEIDCNVLAEE
jgi:hypothetical protein